IVLLTTRRYRWDLWTVSWCWLVKLYQPSPSPTLILLTLLLLMSQALTLASSRSPK
ncbi:hypothetical protein CRENBAI_015378, partial [Crenichthys baileyi]